VGPPPHLLLLLLLGVLLLLGIPHLLSNGVESSIHTLPCMQWGILSQAGDRASLPRLLLLPPRARGCPCHARCRHTRRAAA
jgi:hypothetical protein